ncbi:MAG: type I restriction enzyme HsdR N-terminal domain-containing protein [Prolixibacteraceae bacterium]|jgi:type I site-specific restriction endonuclease|nr:type I restriction enzyme HsdR N-terminal domain-containing protein [Prolixibacteraceae bacterium]
MIQQFPQLNFPVSNFKLKEENGKLFIFDVSRKKYIQLTPEEWVRQNCLHYLRDVKKYPISLLSVERGFKVNNKNLRYDIVAYNKQAKPILLVECKAPDVKIDQSTFDQIAAYNLELDVPYLLLTNGIQHYCCVADFNLKKYHFLKEVPIFMTANNQNKRKS